ncbi:hypothetical protein VNO77_23214 [Canavalia gladiata]|uniref:Uncharacterized protein n=1 Tax=Canavalia gladiata TaxID=3824 RepID=A0AAN9L4J8_CANGL
MTCATRMVLPIYHHVLETRMKVFVVPICVSTTPLQDRHLDVASWAAFMSLGGGALLSCRMAIVDADNTLL